MSNSGKECKHWIMLVAAGELEPPTSALLGQKFNANLLF